MRPMTSAIRSVRWSKSTVPSTSLSACGNPSTRKEPLRIVPVPMTSGSVQGPTSAASRPNSPSADSQGRNGAAARSDVCPRSERSRSWSSSPMDPARASSLASACRRRNPSMCTRASSRRTVVGPPVSARKPGSAILRVSRVAVPVIHSSSGSSMWKSPDPPTTIEIPRSAGASMRMDATSTSRIVTVPAPSVPRGTRPCIRKEAAPESRAPLPSNSSPWTDPVMSPGPSGRPRTAAFGTRASSRSSGTRRSPPTSRRKSERMEIHSGARPGVRG